VYVLRRYNEQYDNECHTLLIVDAYTVTRIFDSIRLYVPGEPETRHVSSVLPHTLSLRMFGIRNNLINNLIFILVLSWINQLRYKDYSNHMTDNLKIETRKTNLMNNSLFKRKITLICDNYKINIYLGIKSNFYNEKTYHEHKLFLYGKY